MTPREFKAVRKRLGLSIAEMAEALGISPRHVRRLEKPKNDKSHRPITPTMARLIAAIQIGAQK